MFKFENKENDSKGVNILNQEKPQVEQRSQKPRRSVLKEFDPFAPDSPQPHHTKVKPIVIDEDETFEDAQTSFTNFFYPKAKNVTVENDNNTATLHNINCLIPELQDYTLNNPNDISDACYMEAVEDPSQIEASTLNSDEEVEFQTKTETKQMNMNSENNVLKSNTEESELFNQLVNLKSTEAYLKTNEMETTSEDLNDVTRDHSSHGENTANNTSKDLDVTFEAVEESRKDETFHTKIIKDTSNDLNNVSSEENVEMSGEVHENTTTFKSLDVTFEAVKENKENPNSFQAKAITKTCKDLNKILTQNNVDQQELNSEVCDEIQEDTTTSKSLDVTFEALKENKEDTNSFHAKTITEMCNYLNKTSTQEPVNQQESNSEMSDEIQEDTITSKSLDVTFEEVKQNKEDLNKTSIQNNVDQQESNSEVCDEIQEDTTTSKNLDVTFEAVKENKEDPNSFQAKTITETCNYLNKTSTQDTVNQQESNSEMSDEIQENTTTSRSLDVTFEEVKQNKEDLNKTSTQNNVDQQESNSEVCDEIQDDTTTAKTLDVTFEAVKENKENPNSFQAKTITETCKDINKTSTPNNVDQQESNSEVCDEIQEDTISSKNLDVTFEEVKENKEDLNNFQANTITETSKNLYETSVKDNVDQQESSSEVSNETQEDTTIFKRLDVTFEAVEVKDDPNSFHGKTITETCKELNNPSSHYTVDRQESNSEVSHEIQGDTATSKSLDITFEAVKENKENPNSFQAKAITETCKDLNKILTQNNVDQQELNSEVCDEIQEVTSTYKSLDVTFEAVKENKGDPNSFQAKTITETCNYLNKISTQDIVNQQESNSEMSDEIQEDTTISKRLDVTFEAVEVRDDPNSFHDTITETCKDLNNTSSQYTVDQQEFNSEVSDESQEDTTTSKNLDVTFEAVKENKEDPNNFQAKTTETCKDLNKTSTQDNVDQQKSNSEVCDEIPEDTISSKNLDVTFEEVKEDPNGFQAKIITETCKDLNKTSTNSIDQQESNSEVCNEIQEDTTTSKSFDVTYEAVEEIKEDPDSFQGKSRTDTCKDLNKTSTKDNVDQQNSKSEVSEDIQEDTTSFKGACEAEQEMKSNIELELMANSLNQTIDVEESAITQEINSSTSPNMSDASDALNKTVEEKAGTTPDELKEALIPSLNPTEEIESNSKEEPVSTEDNSQSRHKLLCRPSIRPVRNKTKVISKETIDYCQENADPSSNEVKIQETLNNEGKLVEEYKNKNTELTKQIVQLQGEMLKVKQNSEWTRKNVQTQKASRTDEKRRYILLIENYENVIKKQTRDLAMVKAEYEHCNKMFTNTEMAFSDVFEKYQKSKFAIENLQKNEDLLLANLQSALDQVSQNEAKHAALESRLREEVERAKEEIQKEKHKQDSEHTKLQAIVKRLEIKISSLETALKQKTEECQALSALCDDITGQP